MHEAHPLVVIAELIPDEWRNCCERIGAAPSIGDAPARAIELVADEAEPAHILEVRMWASYRAQTLARTVRGMMQYGAALRKQAQMEGLLGGVKA